MCTTVFTDDGEIRTVGKLRKLLGHDNVIADEPSTEAFTLVEPLEDGDCLCWVDVPASAEKAGWVAEHDDFGYRLRKR